MHSASLPHGLISYGLLSGLAIALLAAAAGDLAHRKIGNRLNAAIALAAPLYWWASGLSVVAIGWQLGLGLCVFVLLAALFAAGAMGGGDVKLLSALALWIRPMWYVQLLMAMALCGGGLCAVLLVFRAVRGKRPSSNPHSNPHSNPRGVPYGIAIALGGLWVLICDYLPLASVAARIG